MKLEIEDLFYTQQSNSTSPMMSTHHLNVKMIIIFVLLSHIEPLLCSELLDVIFYNTTKFSTLTNRVL